MILSWSPIFCFQNKHVKSACALGSYSMATNPLLLNFMQINLLQKTHVSIILDHSPKAQVSLEEMHGRKNKITPRTLQNE